MKLLNNPPFNDLIEEVEDISEEEITEDETEDETE